MGPRYGRLMIHLAGPGKYARGILAWQALARNNVMIQEQHDTNNTLIVLDGQTRSHAPSVTVRFLSRMRPAYLTRRVAGVFVGVL